MLSLVILTSLDEAYQEKNRNIKFDNPLSQTTDERLKLKDGLNDYVYKDQTIKNWNNDRVLVVSSSSEELDNSIVSPVQIGKNYLHFIEKVDKLSIKLLMNNPSVRFIYPDLDTSNFSTKEESTTINADGFKAKEILQTDRVWEEFNVTGRGVKISIVDSGVDIGNSDLLNNILRLPNGLTSSYDVTGYGIAITSLEIPSEVVANSIILPLRGENITFWAGEEARMRSSDSLGISFQDMDITEITRPSLSNSYKIGILFQPALTANLINQIFIFILTDSTTSGLYDTIYIDYDTSLALTLSYNDIIPESGETYFSLVDWSLNDDFPSSNDYPFLSRDIDGDNIADVSAGGIGTTLDRFGLINNQQVSLIEGIDPQGRGFAVMYDSIGHGTLSAAVAAASGNSNHPAYDDLTTPEVENSTAYRLPGSAPNAKIIPIKGYTLSDFILGWFWSAGLKPDLNNGGWLIGFEHLADIVSNSWGSGVIAENDELKGMDLYSMMVDLLSPPDLFYSTFPGMIFVVSAGNGGPGYGTVPKPASSSMAITVGASTSYHFLNGTRGNNHGDVASFSGRGPTSYGSIKPDILALGWAGFTHYPINAGKGNGSHAIGMFGGTSESAPRVAGILALVIEAYRKQSRHYDIGDIKVLIKSTAKDTGFPVAMQGNGIINAYESVSSIFDGDQILVGNTQSTKLIGQRLQRAFKYMFGETIDHPFISNNYMDTAIITTLEGLSGNQISLFFGNGTPIQNEYYSIQVERLIKSYQSNFQITSNLRDIAIPLSNYLSNQWLDSDFIQLSMSMDAASWNSLINYSYSTPSVVIRDSVDNKIVSDSLINLAWTQQIHIGYPNFDFLGEPVLTFIDPGFDDENPEWNGIKYLVKLQEFKYQSTDSIILSEDNGLLQLSNNNLINEFQFLSLNITSIKNKFARIPILISTEHLASNATDINYIGSNLDVDTPYKLNETYGSFDWYGRPEAGDFRYYRINISDDAKYLAIMGKWQNEGLIPDMFLFNESGILKAKTDVEYLGSGYYHSSTSESMQQNLLIPTQGGIYIVAVHFARMPFLAGQINFELYVRSITNTIPNPIPIFSQDLNTDISGILNINTGEYHLEFFPEFYLTSISAEILHGSNKVEEIEISSNMVNNQTITTLGDCETFIPIEFEAGDKVQMNLSWEAEADVDFYVTSIQDRQTISNDRLVGSGSTVGFNYEEGNFAVDSDGIYLIYIDVVSLSSAIDNLTLNLSWSTLNGPKLQSDTTSINIDTSYFPNDNFTLKIHYNSNFNMDFITENETRFINHNTFDSNLLSPADGSTLSGNVEITWQSNIEILADVYIQIDGINYQITSDYIDNTVIFDSKQFQNGAALIIVSLSDGNSQNHHSVNVVIDNAFPSSLNPPASTSDSSLAINQYTFIIPLLIPFIAKKINKFTRQKSD
ncbi:MAG: S8 family serine peptidase [Candidatus Heimdallarchaeota archaeon]|nr:S8 family serine peptidase [Candidatus Heimdallarchaeota archaeon]MDH5645229.1 S8 family serine peptidase [Candidatus Heimdallarchaeota archaeon]